MKKPSQQYPSSQTSTKSPMPNILADPSIKGANFDQLLYNRGVNFIHKRAIPCPNMLSLDSGNHDPNCPHCDGNGFLYYNFNNIVGVFSSNQLEKMYEAQGVWEIGTAVLTMPTTYPDGTQADFNTYDQLVMPDFEVRFWELKEYVPTSTGKQKLRYPITENGIDAMYAVDTDNNLVLYEEGIHFNIVDGDIEWISGNTPPYDATEERGEVLSISYYANPVYNVVQLLHETRVTQEMDENGNKIARRLPTSLLIKRDFLFNAPELADN
jgi:hypothetical protein